MSCNLNFEFEDENECENFANYLEYLKKLYNVKKLNWIHHDGLHEQREYFIIKNGKEVKTLSYENYMKMIHRDIKIDELLNGRVE